MTTLAEYRAQQERLKPKTLAEYRAQQATPAPALTFTGSDYNMPNTGPSYTPEAPTYRQQQVSEAMAAEEPKQYQEYFAAHPEEARRFAAGGLRRSLYALGPAPAAAMGIVDIAQQILPAGRDLSQVEGYATDWLGKQEAGKSTANDLAYIAGKTGDVAGIIGGLGELGSAAIGKITGATKLQQAQRMYPKTQETLRARQQQIIEQLAAHEKAVFNAPAENPPVLYRPPGTNLPTGANVSESLDIYKPAPVPANAAEQRQRLSQLQKNVEDVSGTGTRAPIGLENPEIGLPNAVVSRKEFLRRRRGGQAMILGPDDLKRLNEELQSITAELDAPGGQAVMAAGKTAGLPSFVPADAPPEVKRLYEVTQAAKQSKLQQAGAAMGRGAAATQELFDDAAGSVISDRVRKIDPGTMYRMRSATAQAAIQSTRDAEALKPLFQKSRAMPQADYLAWDLAQREGDAKALRYFIQKYDLGKDYKVYRDMDNRILQQGNEVGMDINFLKHHHARWIKDPQGYMKTLAQMGGERWNTIQGAIAKRAEALGMAVEELPMEEKARVADSLLRGYSSEQVKLARPSFVKERQFRQIPPELLPFYGDSLEAKARYFDAMNREITARKFFGKVSPDVMQLRQDRNRLWKRLDKLNRNTQMDPEEKQVLRLKLETEYNTTLDKLANTQQDTLSNSIGSYVVEQIAKGKIAPDQQSTLTKLLNARFNPKGMAPELGKLRDITMITTLGGVKTALNQLGDLSFTAFKYGPGKSLYHGLKSALGKSEITKADLGITNLVQELENTTRTGKALKFSLAGTNWTDRFGIESMANAAWNDYKALATKNDPQLLRRLEQQFGPQAPQVLKDLQAGEKSDNVLQILWSDVMDFRAGSPDEMTVGYMKAGNARPAYWLKSWTIRTMSALRRESFTKMHEGVDLYRQGKELKDAEKIAQGKALMREGTKNLTKLTGYLVLANASPEVISDYLYDREVKLTDSVWNGFMNIVGMNRYDTAKARQEGMATALMEKLLPPVKLFNTVGRDVYNIAAGKDWGESIRNVPAIGELYYQRYGLGKRKRDAKLPRNKPLSPPGMRLPRPGANP